jgi:hypothetical protein
VRQCEKGGGGVEEGARSTALTDSPRLWAIWRDRGGLLRIDAHSDDGSALPFFAAAASRHKVPLCRSPIILRERCEAQGLATGMRLTETGLSYAAMTDSERRALEERIRKPPTPEEDAEIETATDDTFGPTDVRPVKRKRRWGAGKTPVRSSGTACVP